MTLQKHNRIERRHAQKPTINPISNRERMGYFMFINLIKGARDWSTMFPMIMIGDEASTAWEIVKKNLGAVLDVIERNIPDDLTDKFNDDSEKFCNILEAIDHKCTDINKASRAIDLLDIFLYKNAAIITEDRLEDIKPFLQLWDGLSDKDKDLAIKYLQKKQQKNESV
jgi:hypothetical protein